MKDQQLLDRIVCRPEVMTGKPVIKGTRLTAAFIMNLRTSGASERDILDEYTGLTQDDIQACYLFAGKSLASASFMPLMR